MNFRQARRTGVVVAAVVAAVVAGVGPAQATALEEGIGTGTIGSVDATFNGASVQSDPLAECDTDGAATAQSPTYRKPGFVEFGPGSSSCSVNHDTGVASVAVHGTLFRLDALRAYGGPRIRMTNYNVTCHTTANGTSAGFQVGGLSGLSVPQQVPPNYTVRIMSRPYNGRLIAKVTLNEKIAPDPPDGSLTVNIMRIRLFPHGQNNAGSGEIVVGSVSCSPF